MSSIITPKPFLILLSIILAGKIFFISKNLNEKKIISVYWFVSTAIFIRKENIEIKMSGRGSVKMTRINIGTITLNYEERGEGPAFIFIPGLVGLHDAWSFQLDHFSKHYRCVRSIIVELAKVISRYLMARIQHKPSQMMYSN